MKRTYSLAILFVLLVTFSPPSFASANTDGADCAVNGPNALECGAGNICVNYKCMIAGTGSTGNTGNMGSGVNVSVIKGYSDGVISLINNVFVPLLFAVAFLMFLWGVYKYFILGAAEEESRTKGKEFILWGLIGFAVILSVWGLVNIVTSTFSLTPGGAAPNRPTL